ncbi:hypothetical protein [Ralstonia phage RP13]|nr:hypothetical protein [Ralstonia phage RP13]
MKINNWCIVTDVFSGLRGPEASSPRVAGKTAPYSDIITSPIYRLKEGSTVEEMTVITKNGSEYTLGVVDTEYLNLYPDAPTRLFNTLSAK